MENPNPADDSKRPPDPAPVPDPDPKTTPLDPDEHIKDGIEVNET
jgi:hypothetical protein